MTYKNLSTWYTELRQYRPAIPTLLGANKIDENMEVGHQFELNCKTKCQVNVSCVSSFFFVLDNCQVFCIGQLSGFLHWPFGQLSGFFVLANCHQVTTKSFAFAGKNDLPLYYVSAADGTNVVKMFRWQESWCLHFFFSFFTNKPSEEMLPLFCIPPRFLLCIILGIGIHENISPLFYRTQVNLGSDLWVRLSVCPSQTTRGL